VSGRDLEIPAGPAAAQQRAGDCLILKTAPNWTAVVFFACLGLLHACIAIPAFWHGRLEGYLSCAFMVIFLNASVVTYFVRFELTIQTRQRRLRLRSGTRRVAYQRYIPFDDVHGVRLTMLSAPDYPLARIEVLCDNEDIECPPTTVPRQESLCLAMLMGVQLIKVTRNDREGDDAWGRDPETVDLEHAPRI
jgi:hypothetical protein